MAIADSVKNVGDLLLEPKEQMPSLRLRFSAVMREFQAMYNELANTNENWTHVENHLTLDANRTDYTVQNAGKILYVIASTGYDGGNQGNAYGRGVQVSFTNLSSASIGGLFGYGYGGAGGYDYGFSQWDALTFPDSFPFEVAFYRSDGELKMRVSPYFNYGIYTALTVVTATGNWLADVTEQSQAVLSEHHQLAETRAAKTLVSGSEWNDDDLSNENKRRSVRADLADLENRFASNFLYAKRSMKADSNDIREDYYRSDWY